jgi:hypothetical protein
MHSPNLRHLAIARVRRGPDATCAIGPRVKRRLGSCLTRRAHPKFASAVESRSYETTGASRRFALSARMRRTHREERSLMLHRLPERCLARPLATSSAQGAARQRSKRLHESAAAVPRKRLGLLVRCGVKAGLVVCYSLATAQLRAACPRGDVWAMRRFAHGLSKAASAS